MKLFTKFIALLAALCLLTNLVVAQNKKLVVATDTAFVPFEFSQNGKYVGFDIDLWEAIAKYLKLDWELRPLDQDGIIPALQTGNVDVAIAGITITEAREKVVLFSDPYYQSSLSIMVNVENKDINGVKDLNGKIVATQKGSSSAEFIKNNLKPKETKLFPNTDNALLDASLKRVDAVLYDTPTMLYYVNVSNNKKLKLVGEPIEAQDYGIALAKKHTELKEAVNLALKELKKDGTFAKIYAKWFGNN